jgi:predicted Holliday junction resolvase-like endonuclease
VALLVAYLVHLRNRALADRRRRRAQALYAAWVAARQVAIRREQARLAAARREALLDQLARRERIRLDATRRAHAAVRGRGYHTRAVSQ